MKSKEKSIEGSRILGVVGTFSLITVLVLGLTRLFDSNKQEKAQSSYTREVPDWVDGQEY